MIFELLGFAIAVIVLIGATGLFVLGSIYSLGQYNIGGVPHTWKDRVWIAPYGIALWWSWYFIFSHSPFSIAVN